MPRRALRCIVDLQINALSAPGVWLPSKEDVYISISLFNQYRNTRLLTSIFPLLIHEKFRFEKTYYTAVDPSQVSDMLQDELVIFELVQLSEYTDGAVRLASYSTNARDFLYPYPTLAPSYSAHDREVLMCRTIAFPGISPKVEFTTKTIIKESISPELDALDDACDLEQETRRLRISRQRSRSRGRKWAKRRWSPRMQKYPEEEWHSNKEQDLSKKWAWKSEEEDKCPPHYSLPTVTSLCRSRSPSPAARRKLADIDLDSSIDPRPPFVVRKLGSELIGRVPGSGTEKLAKSRAKRSRSVSPFRYRSVDDLGISYSTTPSYRLSQVIRKPYLDPLPVFTPRYRSAIDKAIDKEVEELTSTVPSTYVPTPRPRSVSPLLYKTSYASRYLDPLDPLYRPYSPLWYSALTDLVWSRQTKQKPKKMSRKKTSFPCSKCKKNYTEFPRSIECSNCQDWIQLERERLRSVRFNRIYRDYYKSIDDLDLELRLARIRAGLY